MIEKALVARDAKGEVRAWIRLTVRKWPVGDVVATLQAWEEADPDRTVSIEELELSTALPKKVA